MADIKSEPRPASNRNQWPASYWNAAGFVGIRTLEQFAEASKRVFAELVNGAALYDRMEMLEDLAFYTPRTSDLGLLGLNERNDNQP